MNDSIKLIKSNGMSVSVDIICFLEDTTNGKKYIYYTMNEIVGVEPSSTVKIYVAKIKQNDATDIPISEEEWGKLKSYMGDALKDVDNASIKYLSLDELTDPTVVDERVIAMPTMYDYINKHKQVYKNKVVIAEIKDVSNQPEASVPFKEEVVDTPSVEVAPEIINGVDPGQFAQNTVVNGPKVNENLATVVLDTSIQQETTPSSISSLETIDIKEIEEKYNKLVDDIIALKNKEIEAAERFNATLELSAMHNAQHASYVQNEQAIIEPNLSSTPEPVPTVEPVAIEPTPIAATPSPVDIETNWFDMQPQGE